MPTLLSLIEIPFNLMDVQVSELLGNSSYAGKTGINIQSALDMLSHIRLLGGMVHLNWHQETFWNRRSHNHYLNYLKMILDKILPDNNCWKATLSEVANWRKSQYNNIIRW